MNWSQTLGKLEKNTVSKAAALWNADPDSLEFVSQSANAVYRFTARGPTNYLRLVHRDLRDQEFLAAGIDFARHCSSRGARVSVAFESKRGNLIEAVRQNEDVFLAAVWNGIPGSPLNDDLEPHALTAWSESLALLHAASASYMPQTVQTSSGAIMPESFSLEQFWTNIAGVVSSDPELQAAHAKLGRWLEALPKSEMIVTHNDFRPGNAIWDGTYVTIVDFDEPAMAWPEYDAARAMMRDEDALFQDRPGHQEAFLTGYQRIRNLDVSRIKTFVHVRALLMYAWSLEDQSWVGPKSLRDLAVDGVAYSGI
jgi:Ser/Thr protein kinase RdoA (MazF antagonist)